LGETSGGVVEILGKLASGRQYGNALLGVRHQEEEEVEWEKWHAEAQKQQSL